MKMFGIRKKEQSGERFRWFQIEILMVFVAIVMCVIFILDNIILGSTKRAMQQNASNLIAANSRQIELNINSYLERMETISTLLFSNESYYLYDASDESMDEYDKVKSEENIVDRIVDIGLMENYSDFGIVYSNDHTVGWISHGTQDLFPEGGLYEAFSEYTRSTNKEDGWCFGINGCIDRIYYIKKLNPNALLESATYTRELSSVFIHPEQLKEMTIRLVDRNDTIIYSSDEDEIGESMPNEIIALINENAATAPEEEAVMNSSIISDDYLVNINECTNGWRVISSVPTEIILRDNTEIQRFTLRISGVMAVIFVIIGLLLISNIYRPMDGMVANLKEKAEIDKLSGVMNKAAFQEEVEKRLEEKSLSDISIMIMLDMDNFKQINDRLGHINGDKVIRRTGKLLSRVFDEDASIGRMGGDEFAVYSECKVSDSSKDSEVMADIRNNVINVVNEQMHELVAGFEEEFAEERNTCDISLSAGIYVSDVDHPQENFKAIYDSADKALYESKRNGKAQHTVTGYRHG